MFKIVFEKNKGKWRPKKSLKKSERKEIFKNTEFKNVKIKDRYKNEIKEAKK